MNSKKALDYKLSKARELVKDFLDKACRFLEPNYLLIMDLLVYLRRLGKDLNVNDLKGMFVDTIKNYYEVDEETVLINVVKVIALTISGRADVLQANEKEIGITIEEYLMKLQEEVEKVIDEKNDEAQKAQKELDSKQKKRTPDSKITTQPPTYQEQFSRLNINE